MAGGEAMFWIGLGAGLVIGTFLGIFFIALCISAVGRKNEKNIRDKELDRKNFS